VAVRLIPNGDAGLSDILIDRRGPARSPLSLKIALGQLRRGQNLDFDVCRATEFRIVSRVASGHDFDEGIRAVIVDEDHRPCWRPPTVDAIIEREIERHFAPVADEPDLP
jgi:enoyl-CoA hydratase/carnithine racemase